MNNVQNKKKYEHFSVFFITTGHTLTKLDPILGYSSLFKLRATPSSKREIIRHTLYIIDCILFIVSTFHSYSEITKLVVMGPI